MMNIVNSVRMIQTLNASKIWHRVYFHQLPSRLTIHYVVEWDEKYPNMCSDGHDEHCGQLN